MPASPSSLIASLSHLPTGLDPAELDPAELGPSEVAVDLPAALADVPDPRARRGIRHRLTVVITAAVCAVVAGYRSYTASIQYRTDLLDSFLTHTGLTLVFQITASTHRAFVQWCVEVKLLIDSKIQTHRKCPESGLPIIPDQRALSSHRHGSMPTVDQVHPRIQA